MEFVKSVVYTTITNARPPKEINHTSEPDQIFRENVASRRAR